MKKIILIGSLFGLSMGVSYAAEGTSVINFLNLIKVPVAILLVIILLFALVMKLVGNSEKKSVGMDGDFSRDIRAAIPDFEEEDFLAWVTGRFVKFQKAWSKGAIEEIHPFETENLFEMHNMQLTELKQKNISNIIEGISVKETDIVSFSNKKDIYEIVVHVRATMSNYFVEHDAPNALDSMTPSESFNYYLTFEKQKKNKALTICPACTAPVSPSKNHCEYCRTVFPEAMDQWLLAKMAVV